MGKKYWDEKVELAVAEYQETKDDILFTRTIYPALVTLVESILHTWKLGKNKTSIDEQVNDCIGFIITKFHKYDPTKGTKSYSYFGTIAKNYLILQKNQDYKKGLKLVELDAKEGTDAVSNLQVEHESMVDLDSTSYYLVILADNLEAHIRDNVKIPFKTALLAETIIYLLREYEKIGITSKNMFFWIAKEMTGLNSKEIAKALKDLKPIYKLTKAEFIS